MTRLTGIARGDSEPTPHGVRVEYTPAGFVLRASCQSFAACLTWLTFAAVVAILPFRLWDDLIRGVWTDQGWSLWLTCGFLSLWAGLFLYLAAMAAFSAVGEIRIAKEGDRGTIFTGIGSFGITHRLAWSDYRNAADQALAAVSSGRFGRTIHSIGLAGRAGSYRFGSDLDAPQQAFVIAFLRKQVFVSDPRDPPELAPDPPGPATASPNAVPIDRIRQTLDRAARDYLGSDPEAFSRSARDLLAALRSDYGDRVPVGDAVRLLEKLARDTKARIEISF